MRTTQQLFDLTGKTALITGASRGLGLQMAEALGEICRRSQGADVRDGKRVVPRAGVTMTYENFMGTDDEKYLVPNHYAFLVSEDEFDEIFGRIQERKLEYFADPAGQEPGEIYHHFGGRGVYWADPDGHWLEILTVPYGGWPEA